MINELIAASNQLSNVTKMRKEEIHNMMMRKIFMKFVYLMELGRKCKYNDEREEVKTRYF